MLYFNRYRLRDFRCHTTRKSTESICYSCCQPQHCNDSGEFFKTSDKKLQKPTE